MPPALSTYQQAAQSIYEPQLAADITTAKATTAADISNLESGKGQIETDYETAVQNLTDQTNANVAKISQLYSERLGGNFSGLQGNDIGMMFGKTAEARATIESTRANKLAAITTGETNAENSLNANISSLTSKYQGEKAKYASDSYDSAVKDYNSNILKQEKIGISASNKAQADADKLAAQYTTKQGSQGQYFFKGPNGVPVSMAAFAQGAGLGTGAVLSLLQNGTSYDKNVYSKVKSLSGDALASALSKYKVYGF